MPSTSNELKIEDQLWKAADIFRGSMDPADYSNVVLGLIFLKYISDSFEEEHYKLKHSKYPEDAEDKLAYTAHNIFWLPKEARWNVINLAAKSPKIGKVIDKAMEGIEKENTQLKGILPKNYESPDLDTNRLGEVIDLITNIPVGNAEFRKKDVLGRVYEFFLKQFASAEGKHGGDFYTPRSIVRTLVEMIEPYKGRVYDPCCGSGGMFVQSQAFIRKHRGNINDISVYGQESNPKTWKLCKMNLAIRGIDSNLGPRPADTFIDDLHKGNRFDYILANPPFNQKHWGKEKLEDDPRWKYGVPPKNNANYAWLQHILSKLAPNGKAGVVLANGSLSTFSSEELSIRKNIINNDKLDAIVELPGKMFYSTSISASLWIFNNNKEDGIDKKNHSNRVLFINASNLGKMVDRTHREFTSADIKKIADTYNSYCGNISSPYRNKDDFCQVVNISDIRKNHYILTPGRYIKIPYETVPTLKLNQDIKETSNKICKLFHDNQKLENSIKKILKDLNNEM